MCLRIMAKAFKSSSQYAKGRDNGPMKYPRSLSRFQICHRGKHEVKGGEIAEKKRKKKISTISPLGTQLSISKETELDGD